MGSGAVTVSPGTADGAPRPTRRRLLSDHVRIAEARGANLVAVALRTASRPARELLAHVATNGVADLTELLDSARERDITRLRAMRIKGAALADLAYVMAMQVLEPDDAAVALTLLDLRLELFGPDRRPRYQALHTQLALTHGQPGRAEQLLATYKRLPAQYREHLRIDLLNPFRQPRRDPGPWLSAFAHLLPRPHLVLRHEPDARPFDRIGTAAVATIDHGPTISVVVPCFQPGLGLVTAVRSLINQTWANVEIIVVDDGSPAEYADVLETCRGLDPRVRVIALPDNGGTYVARNTGVEAATGEFVTFQDSDDWSHPTRLQAQVAPMIRDDALVATTSDGLRVDDDLMICLSGRPRQLLNTSSLMFRKDRVVGRIGYFDEIRKSADTEYLMRITAAFGDHAVQHIPGRAYALIRVSGASVSSGEFRGGWRHPSRRAYQSAYTLWHRQMAPADTVGHREPVPTASARDSTLRGAAAVPGHPVPTRRVRRHHRGRVADIQRRATIDDRPGRRPRPSRLPGRRAAHGDVPRHAGVAQHPVRPHPDTDQRRHRR
jgi:Glycosyltransferases involved in cell wall biogenesis